MLNSKSSNLIQPQAYLFQSSLFLSTIPTIKQHCYNLVASPAHCLLQLLLLPPLLLMLLLCGLLPLQGQFFINKATSSRGLQHLHLLWPWCHLVPIVLDATLAPWSPCSSPWYTLCYCIHLVHALYTGKLFSMAWPRLVLLKCSPSILQCHI